METRTLNLDEMAKIEGGFNWNKWFVCDVAIMAVGAAWGSLAGPIGTVIGGSAASLACNYYWAE